MLLPQLVSAEKTQGEIALIYVNEEINEDVQILYELLSIYETTDLLAVQDVDRGRLLSYERVIVFNSSSAQMPAKAVQALNDFRGVAIAIGNSALQLAPFAEWHIGEETTLLKIGDKILNNPLSWQIVQPSEDAEVVKTSASFSQKYPFVVEMPKSNWSYIALFAKELVYEWPSIISQLLQLHPPSNHEAFIVLSDINMKTNVEHLEKLVTILRQYEVPVVLEIAPFYEENRELLHLENNKPLIKYLQSLQRNEASFVLAPPPAEAVEKSLDYLVQNRIYPTLLNGNSPIFSHLVQMRPLHIYRSIHTRQHIFPYTVQTAIDAGDNPLYRMEQTITQLLRTPGAIISFQYPSYADATHLVNLIELVQRPNVQWLDFQALNSIIQAENVVIKQTVEGKLNVQLSFSIFERLRMYFDHSPFEFGLWILVITVVLFVLLFFMNTLRLRMTLRKRLFEERKNNG